MIRLAIFASGSGSNAENIANYFDNSTGVEISLILTNNKNAGVLERAERLSIDSEVFDRDDFQDPEKLLKLLKNKQIDLVILAGFLWLVPIHFINAYPDRIINIHPALLPMYGDRVHKQVKEAGEEETGITIHYVNGKYDEGQIIFQDSCQINESDTPESIAAKVHKLEYEHYPRVIEGIVNKVGDF